MFGRAIHDYEYHSGTICGDVDANVMLSAQNEGSCSVVIVLLGLNQFCVWKDTNERARYIQSNL